MIHTERERESIHEQTNKQSTHTHKFWSKRFVVIGFQFNSQIIMWFRHFHGYSCTCEMPIIFNGNKKQNFRRLYSRSFAQLKYLRLLRVKCVQSMRIYQMKWNLALKFQQFEAYRTDGGWKLANRLLFHLTVERNKNFSSDSIIT